MTVLPPAWFGSGVRVFWEKRNGASGQEWFGAWFPTGTVSSGESSISADTSLGSLTTSAAGGTGGSGVGTGTAGANGSAGNVVTHLGVS